MPKNVFFLEKSINRHRVGGSVLEPLFISGGWGLHAQTTALFLSPTAIVLSGAFGLRLCFTSIFKTTKVIIITD